MGVLALLPEAGKGPVGGLLQAVLPGARCCAWLAAIFPALIEGASRSAMTACGCCDIDPMAPAFLIA